MSSKYTKREFQKDLKKLAQLIEEHDKMERKQSSRRNRRQRGGNDQMSGETHGEEHGHSAHAEQEGGRRRQQRRQQRRHRGGMDNFPGMMEQEGSSRRQRRRQRGGDHLQAWNNDWNEWAPIQEGGKKDKRTFKVVSVGGKAVSFGTYTITKDSPIGPGRAATKAASSVCAHVTGKTGRHSISPQCNGVKFMLKEKTRGSSQKEYGPYEVVVHKRSPKELKDLEKRFKNFGKGKYKPSHHTATAVLVHHK
jgi:hypothetical protein